MTTDIDSLDPQDRINEYAHWAQAVGLWDGRIIYTNELKFGLCRRRAATNFEPACITQLIQVEPGVWTFSGFASSARLARFAHKSAAKRERASAPSRALPQKAPFATCYKFSALSKTSELI